MGVAGVWFYAAIVWGLGLYCCPGQASDSPYTRRPSSQSSKEGVVCKTIDIRNQVENFAVLENCTVIEGSLSILLIDYATKSDYAHLHFPKLREITDYLLLYRAFGLQTLSHIFPNLAVIRGQRLFYNYALVAFEMPDLEDLGLASLTHIVRGAVRLEKNPKLCYIHTLDLTKIARSVTMEDHFIMENNDIDACPNVCPARSSNVFCNNNKLGQKPFCWNSQNCQRVCKGCESRECYVEEGSDMMKCCDAECIGGCTGPTNKDCVACKHVFFQGRCQERCPSGTYEYRNRRCITEKECRDLDQHGPQKGPKWKIHNDKCVHQCPHGYVETADKHRCERCAGACPKICETPPIVDNIAGAQRLKECTEIRGILEIQIRGGSRVGHELEDNLGLIEVVTDHVRIVRSYAIVSLHFLKSLKVIKGEKLSNDRYALFVLDNQNLQDIWDFKTHPNLTLGRGRVFFHQNRKLCLHKIQEFIQFTTIPDKLDDMDISPTTNGDQVACNISALKLRVLQSRSTYAVVSWPIFRPNDERELLNYVVYYREAPIKNITIFDARDACGTDVWKAVDVRSDDDPNAINIMEVIYQLQPYTQYAIYVQTYTISTANQGAMSSVVYFMTQPEVPTHPRDIKVEISEQNQLTISWKPPSRPNGDVTHYVVYWAPQKLSQEKLDQRNYCDDKLHFVKSNKVKTTVKENEKNVTLNGQCCDCPKSEEEEKHEEDERMFQIEFENYLHDSVYVKRPIPPATRSPQTEGASRSRRELRRELTSSGSHNALQYGNVSLTGLLALGNGSLNANIHNDSEEEDDHDLFLSATVYRTEIVIPNLGHFTEYIIEVIACHDYEEEQDIKRCSNRAITTARTLPSESADNLDIQNITIHNDSAGDVLIKWPDPPNPNGLIVTYEIRYYKTGENKLMNIPCIPHKEYRKLGGYVIPAAQLVTGNYSFEIRATSLAGNGSWTESKFFYVPDKIASQPALKNEAIIGGVVGVLILILVLASCTVWYVAKKRFNNDTPDGILYASVNPEYMSAGDVYIPDEWEVPREKIEIKRELGQGSFGMVYEGIAKGLYSDREEMKKGLISDKEIIKVAVKTVNEKATLRDRIEFLNEASVMKAFNCNHVVKLIGVVSKGQPTLVIMELMANGDLKNFLRMHRPDAEENNGRKPPSLKDIQQWAGEIADGMAYLAAKKFVHRDLAARNCMVSESHVVKIGDFGMTRDIYETDYYRKGGKGLLPVRWMAPESLKDGIFTSQSDVWSFGVVLWEMATLAAQPYQGLANEQVLQFVIDANIMEQPKGCPETLYELMLLCWRHNPKHRPTFLEIVESLVPELDPSFKEVSYFFSEENQRDVEAARAHNLAEQEMCADSDFEDPNDSRTPLTGSPRMGSLSDVSLDTKLTSHDTREPGDGMDESRSNCSHEHPCRCVDINEAGKSKRHTVGVNGSSNTGRNAGLTRPRSTTSSLAGGNNPMPPSGSSNEGSKESSKSSGSSYFHMNGIANGHIPRGHMPSRYTEC